MNRTARRASRLAFSLALLSTAPAPLSLPAASERPAPSGPKGSLVIVGGGPRSEALMRRFVELGGGPGRARIAVVPMASEEAVESGADLLREFDGLGAGAFVFLVDRVQADSDAVARRLDSATGIWFGGGDQTRLTAALRGTRSLRAMHDRFRAGAVVGGTSAGAAVMSDSMITGNQTPPGDTTGYYGDEYPEVGRRRVQVAPGLGFLPGAIVDQHFLRRERHNRLLSAVLERPRLVGVGIDESTAIEVGPDGRWRVLGESDVLVVDARRSRITPPDSPELGASDLILHLLPPGSVYDPGEGRATLPPR